MSLCLFVLLQIAASQLKAQKARLAYLGRVRFSAAAAAADASTSPARAAAAAAVGEEDVASPSFLFPTEAPRKQPDTAAAAAKGFVSSFSSYCCACSEKGTKCG